MAVTRDDRNQCIAIGHDPPIAFSRCFGAESSQRDVYEHCCAEQVQAVLGGLDACVLAYGQTGAGKTYSMIGPEGGRVGATCAEAGILPLAAAEIFCAVAQLEAESALSSSTCSHRLWATFVELHREGTFDLLSSTHRAKLVLRESGDGASVEGATRVRVRSTHALLAAVASGSARRHTAETGVHAHSSRSHALLVLTLEKRWRTGKVVPGGGGHAVECRTSTLTLCDLAGSEGLNAWSDGHGDATADGIATNLGLHVLGRCITALACGEAHVPYRDATLTRLLKHALAGRCQTRLLVCLSPAGRDAAESRRVLKYALAAQQLVGTPSVRLSQSVEADPMADDVADDEAALQRRCVWLHAAGFGAVFARVAGEPTQPLLLYVHGSGPANSSRTWTACIEDAARSFTGYYHVAIDCPGYGRSPGDRQTIRSYPGAFLAAVVRATGHHRAAALVGSSQGAAAVFNAALEQPKLCERLAVCHPVGHAVERYARLPHPTLLAFDIDDDGHPVSIGRRMRAVLPLPTYFEYSSVTDEAQGKRPWLDEHFAAELTALVTRHAAPWPAHRGKELPELASLAGGLHMWSRPYAEGEYGPWYRDADGSAVQRLREEEAEKEDSVAATTVTGAAESEGGEVPTASDDDGMMTVGANSLSRYVAGRRRRYEAESEGVLFSDASTLSDEDEAEAAETDVAAAELAAECAQTQCELCMGSLGAHPVRLAACRHALCECCILRTAHVLAECPVCGILVTRVNKKAIIGSPRAVAASVVPQAQSAEAAAAEAVAAAQAKAAAKAAVILEYGNDSIPVGGKISYKTFVRVLRGGGEIKRVSYNINPSFSKPTANVDRPNDAAHKGAFTFEYAMARPYPCVVTVELAKPPMVLTLNYAVCNGEQDAAGGGSTRRVARRVAIAPPDAKRNRVPKVTLQVNPPRSAWVQA